MSWKERYDRMKKHYGWTDMEIARMVGYSEKSINIMIRREPFPRQFQLAILVFEEENRL